MFSYMFVFLLLKTVSVFWRSDTAATEKDEGVPPSLRGEGKGKYPRAACATRPLARQG